MYEEGDEGAESRKSCNCERSRWFLRYGSLLGREVYVGGPDVGRARMCERDSLNPDLGIWTA